MVDEIDENSSHMAQPTSSQLGDIVLRADPIDDSVPPSQIEPLEYSSPAIEAGALGPAAKAWRAAIACCLCLVIILVLMTGLPKFQRGGVARPSAARADIASLEAALNTYQIDTNQYPSTTAGLQALVQPPANVANWRGPYVKAIPADPWGRPYLYRSPGTVNKGSFDLFSAGSDKKFGTADDLVNWTINDR